MEDPKITNNGQNPAPAPSNIGAIDNPPARTFVAIADVARHSANRGYVTRVLDSELSGPMSLVRLLGAPSDRLATIKLREMTSEQSRLSIGRGANDRGRDGRSPDIEPQRRDRGGHQREGCERIKPSAETTGAVPDQPTMEGPRNRRDCRSS
jgi:hypothetical protein